MRSVLPAIVFAVAAAAWFTVSAAPAQVPDPVAADPQHVHLEFQNQWVRVFREQMGPHEQMPMHQHPNPGAVVVLLTDRHNRLTAPDGTAKEYTDRAGTVMWAAPSTHRGENLTGNHFEAIQIEPRVPAGAKASATPLEPTDASLIDRKNYHVELDNEYVRVLRVTLGPHEKIGRHTHPQTGAVLVHLTDQNLRLTQADGSTSEHHYKAGQVRWVAAGGPHQDENLSDAPLRFLRIELKFARAN